MPSLFKGFKQVTLDAFNATVDSEKIGYLWFVRSNISGNTYDGDIYFGTKHYGHVGTDVQDLEDRLNIILRTAGVVDESGNPVVLSDIYLTKVEAAQTYATKSELFNTNESGGTLGVLVIAGDDVTNE